MHQHTTALYDLPYQAPTAAQAKDLVPDLRPILGRLGREVILQVDQIDLYYEHGVDKNTPIEETVVPGRTWWLRARSHLAAPRRARK